MKFCNDRDVLDVVKRLMKNGRPRTGHTSSLRRGLVAAIALAALAIPASTASAGIKVGGSPALTADEAPRGSSVY